MSVASIVMHLAVGEKVNEVLNLDKKLFTLGNIAPDITKNTGIERSVTHFTDDYSNIPMVDKFFSKYKDCLSGPYEIGYLVHLITDELWFKEFIPNYELDNFFILKDGEKVGVDKKVFLKLLYNDYNYLNQEVLDYYNLDLSVFYDEYEFPDTVIEEVPKMFFRTLVDGAGALHYERYSESDYVLTLENVIAFIEYATSYVLDRLKDYGILK